MNYRLVSMILGVCCVGLLVWGLRLRKAEITLKAEIEELIKQLDLASRRLARYETEQKSKAFAKVVNLLAAAWVPGLILLGAMAVSGFSGGAAITVALASIGGPAGMFGGIGVLVSLGIVIAKYGVTDLSIAMIRKSLETRSKTNLIQEIDALPRATPEKFRLKAKSLLESE